MTTALLLLVWTCPAASQERFEAIPKESAARYRIDFARHFFASPEAEKAERARLYATLKNLETLKGQTAASADNLLRALRLFDEMQVLFYRHYTYLYLRYAVNTKDRESYADSNSLDAEVTRRTSFLRQELKEIDERKWSQFVARRPTLKPYLFAVESARRYRTHALPLSQEELLQGLAPVTRDWQYELYQSLLARTQFGTVNTKEGELSVARQRAAIANHPDRAVREAGFKKRYAGFAAQRDLYAFTLLQLASARNRLAQLHHYRNAPDEAYFNSYLTVPEVTDLLEQVARRADLYKRYQRARAAHVGKIIGDADVNIWDMSVSPEGMKPPRFTIEEASRDIRAALAPLGAEYGRELASLLDPANGRMDIVPGVNRKSGGFSKGFPSVESVFFSSNFEGSYNDVRVLAHESTHAVHRQLMSRNRVLPAYAEGPHYLFESFAIFNELLLPDYLLRQETDPLRRQYYLEQFLEGKGIAVIFTVAAEASVEQAVYEGVERGDLKSADALDAIAKRTGARYSIWPDKHDELKMQWMTQSLFYEDPLYDINYLCAAILALKYYELYTRDPQQFVPRYIALMRNGFDAPPAALLRRFLDIDLRDPQLAADAFQLLEGKIKMLEAEYSK